MSVTPEQDKPENLDESSLTHRDDLTGKVSKVGRDGKIMDEETKPDEEKPADQADFASNAGPNLDDPKMKDTQDRKEAPDAAKRARK